MRVKKQKSVEAVLPLPLTCLEQAEICREQARDAARLKRYSAALGLFSTAAALCKRASGFHDADDSVKATATDRLRQIDLEMATYADLARSMERPISMPRAA